MNERKCAVCGKPFNGYEAKKKKKKILFERVRGKSEAGVAEKSGERAWRPQHRRHYYMPDVRKEFSVQFRSKEILLGRMQGKGGEDGPWQAIPTEPEKGTCKNPIRDTQSCA